MTLLAGPAPSLEIDPSRLPPMARVRQTFPRPRVADPAGEARRQVGALLEGRLRPGAEVAITAGSRGIAGIAAILAACADAVRAAGGRPFFVSAMGSHGGGTAEGQRAVLAELGLTEESLGAPLRVGTETVVLGRTASGFEVHCDRHAAAAAAILVVNRVKAHTAFHGPNESGLLKMMAIGLGKVPGATAIHRLGPVAMAKTVPEAAEFMRARLPVIGGLAIVENGYEETALLRAVPSERMAAEERELLRLAKSLMPGLPVRGADLLIVDQMGKNFSGTGMDVNVHGRWGSAGGGEPPDPDIARLVVLDLSPGSHGNANGVGLADITTARLAARIDLAATYLNSITTGFLDRAKIPMVMADDRSAIAAALRTLGDPDPAAVRALRIRNTLHLEELWCSPAVLPLLPAHCAVDEPPRPMSFDASGRLL